MHGLPALGIRGLFARPLRSTLTLAGIALGVAVLFASTATSAGIEAAIDRTVAGVAGRADLRVAALQEAGLGDATVARIVDTPGVAAAAPTLERSTYLGPGLLGPGDRLPSPVTVLGIDVAVEPRVRDLVLAAGALPDPADRHAALVTETLADADGLTVGSELVIQGSPALVPFRFTVAGILAGDGPVLGTGGRTVMLPLDIAATLFEADGATRVDLVLAPGATTEQVTAALADRLLVEPYVVSTRDGIAASLRLSTADFQGMTALIAAIALFAGAFLVHNTLSMTVAERRREVALLRAAGATRGQVAQVVLAQAVALGLAGSLAGLALGALLAVVVAGSVGAVGSVPLDRPVLTPSGALGGLAVGLGVTVAAAFGPARRAGRVPPAEALRPPDRTGDDPARVGSVVAVFAAVAILGLLAWPPAGGAPALVRATVVYLVLLAVTLALPFILPTLARIGGLPFAAVVRFEARLARAALVRDPGRATLTVGALGVALAMLVALGGMSRQVHQAAAGWLEDVVPGELVLTSIRPVALDEGVDEILGEQRGVASLSPIATFEVAVDGLRTDAAAVAGRDLAADGRLRFVAGDRAAALAALDAGGAAILPERLADRLGAGPGTTLSVPDGSGAVLDLVVAGVVERTLPGRTGETMLVGWTDAVDRLGVAGADAFAVRFDPSATADDRTAFAIEARGLALEPVPLDRIETAVGDALTRVFGLFDALALVAVVVASLGVVNTLSMNVLERVREIGVLRAAGMTRRQVWRMVVVEAGILGLTGAIAGSVGGILAGTVLVLVAGGRPDPASLVPWFAVALAFVLGVVLAMLAAAYPARLAAGLPIVRAVRYE